MKKPPFPPPGFVPRQRVHKTRPRIAIVVPPGPVRMRRLVAGVRLGEAAEAAGISIAKASRLERGQLVAPEDLARLDAAVSQLAAPVRI